MAALNLKSIRLSTLALGVALALAPSALAADVSVQLDAGAGFSVKNNTGAIQRLRVDEATGNVSRNGALFVHTTGTNNTFVGVSAGNTSTTGIGGNSALGAGALGANTTGFNNSAFGDKALGSNTTGRYNSAVGSHSLFSNTTGDQNSAVGYSALRSNTTSDENSAFGYYSLRSNTSGEHNSAFGDSTLHSNTTGNANSAFGDNALSLNTTGGSNAAFGDGALYSSTTSNQNSAFGANALYDNTTGYRNSAFGESALHNNTIGNRNIAVGNSAGFNLTTGSDNIYLANVGVAGASGQIRIGTQGIQTATTIAGIRGVTTGSANAIPVLIDSTGQLGTTSSSLRVKKEIRDMGDATDRLLALRPVMFRYKPEQKLLSGELPPEYGLIAEEVAKVFPDLVVYDEAGLPFTVKYHVMAPMLLNEMKKQQQVIAELSSRLALLEGRAGSAAASEGATR